MMKKLLLLAVLTVASIAARGAETWWGYWTPSQGLQAKAPLNRGANDIAIRVPANHPQLGGSTVRALRFYISDTTAVIRLRTWISSREFEWGWEKPDIALKEVDLSTTVDLQHGDGSPTTVYFDTPVTLPADGACIGYTLTLGPKVTDAPCQLLCSTATDGTPGGCIYAWSDNARYVGNTALQVLLSSPAIGEHAAELSMPSTQVKEKGEGRPIAMTLTSTGAEPISSIAYSMSVGGTTLAEGEYNLGEGERLDGLLSQTHISLPVDLPLTAGLHEATLTITQVNGQPNQASMPSATTTLTVLDRQGLRRSVLEEFTGTWCTWCPRGIVGLELAEAQFADRFIGIAAHIDDPMQILPYAGSKVKRMTSGLPNAVLNRTTVCDPYMGTSSQKHYMLGDDIAQSLALPCVADIELEAHWHDTGDTLIDITANTTFWYNQTQAAPYAIALVILADSLTGSGSSWAQINRYAQADSGFDDDDMATFRSAPHTITDMAYNHVPIAAAGLDTGLPSSISLPLQSGQSQQFTHQFDVSKNTLLQNTGRLSVVALLLNTSLGTIENAARAHVSSASTADIVFHNVSGASPVPSAYYSPDGRSISGPRRGLNLVRLSDGTVRKLMVR